jgi:hypothetical protein
MALEQRKPKGVIHHSDQGSQAAFNRSSQHPALKELQWGNLNTAAADVECDHRLDQLVTHQLA